MANFPIYIFEGYTNFGWLDETDAEVSVSQIKDAVKTNGIHLYAGWNPISYKVVYHIRGSAVANIEETFYYDTEYLLKVPNDIDSSISHLGYKAAGWTRNKNSDIYSPNVQFKNGETVSNLTSEADAIIDLYDIWEPIEYTIIFSTVDGMEEIADLSAKYNTAYTLPTPSRPGYEFNCWKLNNGDTHDAGVKDPNLDSKLNLSNIDGSEIILTPDFTEIIYTITFRLNGGQAPRDLTIVEGYKKSLRYTESYTLPYLTKEGYTVYSWYCNSNGKTYGSEDRIVGEFTTACDVTFSAVWTSAIYTINYDCYGGNISGESYVISNRYWDDGASLLKPTRIGYTFVKWQDTDNDIDYVPGDAAWSGNLIKSSAENGTQFNLKAIWQIKYYNLKVSTGTGTYLTVKVNNQTKSDGTHSVAYNSTITVSYGANTGYSNVKCTYTGGNMPANDLSISSSAQLTVYKVTKENGSNGSKISISYDKTNSYTYGSIVKFTLTIDSGYEKGKYVLKYGNNGLESTNSGWSNNKLTAQFTMPAANVTITVSCEKSCVAAGSLVLMADGSQKKIEKLKVGDMVMTWDFFTGQIQASPITIYWNHGVDLYTVITLTFSNGYTLKIVGTHGVFDSTTNSFVYLDARNCFDYIGHTFIGFDDDTTQQLVLIDVQVSEEMTGSYSLETACNGNAIIEGMLTLTPQEYVELFVMFEIGDDLKYNTEQIQADIDKYGLYSYDEWAEYVTYDEFTAFNGQYMKIIVGKNIMSKEDLIRLIKSWLRQDGNYKDQRI